MKKSHSFILVIVLMAGAFVAGGLLRRPSAAEQAKSAFRSSSIENPAEIEEEVDVSSLPPGTVQIGRGRQDMIGVKSGPVEIEAVTHTFRLLGRVAADETRSFVVNATVDGWIMKTRPNSTGSYVRKNEVLAEFYSPEFLSAVQSFLFALNSMDQVRVSGKETIPQKDQLAQFNINLQQYKDSLRNLGMGERQIEALAQTRNWIRSVEITSPSDGIILARNVSDGLRFVQGTELYRIADLSRVWIVADVFENEARFFKPGTKAAILLPLQNRTIPATVSNVLPVFDGSTRTLKLRLEADNPGFTLRPDMFADVELPVTLPASLTVPAGAVLYSGLRTIVFVDRGQGIFEPRRVETGWRLGDRIEITNGLKPGERIVLSGNFFVDSESRLQTAAQGIYGEVSVDPVSGESVDAVKAAANGLKSTYQGKTFHFASAENKARFDKAPASFAEKAARKQEHPLP